MDKTSFKIQLERLVKVLFLKLKHYWFDTNQLIMVKYLKLWNYLCWCHCSIFIQKITEKHKNNSNRLLFWNKNNLQKLKMMMKNKWTKKDKRISLWHKCVIIEHSVFFSWETAPQHVSVFSCAHWKLNLKPYKNWMISSIFFKLQSQMKQVNKSNNPKTWRFFLRKIKCQDYWILSQFQSTMKLILFVDCAFLFQK